MRKKITIHCSASKNGQPMDISEIRKMHMKENGWSDVGYHVTINVDGEAQKGRGLNESGAHVSGHNKDNIGICLIGTDKFTRAQFDSLRNELDSIRMVYQVAHNDIYCHHEFDSAKKQGKTCPNIRAADLVIWYALDDERAIEKYILK